MRNISFVITLILHFGFSLAQDTIPYQTIQFGPEKCYSRALHVVKNDLYIGASDGTFIKYNLKTNELKKFISPKGFTEIRDIERAKNQLLLMESSDSSEVYRFDMTTELFTKTELPRKDVFLNGISKSYAIGDPIDNLVQFYSLKSESRVWNNNSDYFSRLKITPTIFAASGTTIIVSSVFLYILSGGQSSNLICFDILKKYPSQTEIPMLKGESSGPYSMAIHPKKRNMVIVGGDYKRPNYSDSCAVVSFDKGQIWQISNSKTGGYRSCVTFIKNKTFITCGPTGSDISYDGGLNWKPFMKGVFHACVVSKRQIIMSSSNGKIIIIDKKDVLKE